MFLYIHNNVLKYRGNVILLTSLNIFNLQVTHGATSVQLSNRERFPSFFRTSPSDKFQVQAIVQILKEFKWNWVAFIGGDTDYSRDALRVFESEARLANVCLAYRGIISVSNDSQNENVLKVINEQRIGVVVLFAHIEHVTSFLRVAIKKKVRKVWIGSETWSLNTELVKENNIDSIGTVLGVTLQQMAPLKGLSEFIRKSLNSKQSPPPVSSETCGQRCDECTNATAETIISQESTFSFSIYSAIHAVAHALHTILSCNSSSCRNSTVEPQMVSECV